MPQFWIQIQCIWIYKYNTGKEFVVLLKPIIADCTVGADSCWGSSWCRGRASSCAWTARTRGAHSPGRRHAGGHSRRPWWLPPRVPPSQLVSLAPVFLLLKILVLGSVLKKNSVILAILQRVFVVFQKCYSNSAQTGWISVSSTWILLCRTKTFFFSRYRYSFLLWRLFCLELEAGADIWRRLRRSS